MAQEDSINCAETRGTTGALLLRCIEILERLEAVLVVVGALKMVRLIETLVKKLLGVVVQAKVFTLRVLDMLLVIGVFLFI